MGEEAFDEVLISCANGTTIHITGGFGREDVWIGIGQSDDPRGLPLIVAELDADARRELRAAIKRMLRWAA